MNLAQRPDDGVPHSGQPVRTSRTVRRLQLLVDPTDQVAVGNVPNEQVQRIGGLVEAAVAQVMRWQWTAADVIGLGAGPPQLGVVAALKVPVALELGATGISGKFFVDLGPSHVTMLLHVGGGDLIRDTLVTERCDQPIEDRRGVVLSYCCSDAVSLEVGADLVDQVRGPGQAAHAVNHLNRVIDGGCPVVNFRMFFAFRLATLDCRAGAHAQINDTSLRCASLSPSMYRCVVWIDR